MKPGKFITLEGGEGVGKSTNLAFIESYLRNKNISLVVTREPGGTPLAEEIRELVLAKREESIYAMTELLLIFAARAQHLHKVICPAIERGDWVLCDRFTDATFAYQGGGRELPVKWIQELEGLVQGSIRPDLTLLLDADIKVGLERAKKRAELDRFESEQVDFFEKVREAYLGMARENPKRYRIVDASKPLPQVHQSIRQYLDEALP